MSHIPLDVSVNGELETDGCTEALRGQMFLCDADVAAVHANDAAVHTF